ncbi:hypothetical protein HPB49_014040 [Dermacentor silvarum]|uniref:Uncharacterized protein n=1 Tax=Dermacentor silvarum TaxID=543639 RepID=A0ACB8DDN1_DERSI|nr:hypothetical protein HPB49_014040 [Dermacentor silvarum]
MYTFLLLRSRLENSGDTAKEDTSAQRPGRGLVNYQQPNASRPYVEVIVVPVKDVAGIIGRGGSRIREHPDFSGACMWVKKDDADNYFEIQIELSGPEEVHRKGRKLNGAIVYPPEEPVCSSKCEEPAAFARLGQAACQE